LPHCTALSRRDQTLEVATLVLHDSAEAIHPPDDSTRLKLFGKGEQKVRGLGSRRAPHLA